MARSTQSDIPTKPTVKWLSATAVAGLLVAALAFAQEHGSSPAVASPASDLLAQAPSPPPIELAPLTARAVFPDAIGLDLSIGLQGGELIEMAVTEPSHTVVARITVQPGAQFPWHTHPGPILVNVAEGALVYIPASDCTERLYPAGTAFFDPGRGNVHTAYNASAGVTVLMATFFEVPAEGPLTITEGITVPADCDVAVGVHGDH